MYPKSKLKRTVAAALLLATALATVMLIAPKVMGSGAGMPPPPPINTGSNTVTQAQSSGGQSANTAPETPPPISTKTTSSNSEAPQPPSPPVPSTTMLKDDARRELWHAYREYNATIKLLSYAAKKGVAAGSDTQYFKALAEDLYNKALTAFSNGNYVAAKAYARLSVESMHSLRDIVTYELSVKGIAPPPPAGPPSPP